jgi:hypothetical protein
MQYANMISDAARGHVAHMLSLTGWICLTLLLGCKHSTDPGSEYPKWVIYATVLQNNSDGQGDIPVTGCPSVRWHYAGEAETHAVGCYHSTNAVLATDHINGTVTINYEVLCDGFNKSDVRNISFKADSAHVWPGRGGPEVRYETRVVLHRE